MHFIKRLYVFNLFISYELVKFKLHRDLPCGEGGPMLQSQQTGLVLAPRRGPCPPGLTCLQETEDHTAQEAGAHGGGRAGRGPSGLSVDERGEGLSRESF